MTEDEPFRIVGNEPDRNDERTELGVARARFVEAHFVYQFLENERIVGKKSTPHSQSSKPTEPEIICDT